MHLSPPISVFFFFNDTATTEIYTLSLHDALPIYDAAQAKHPRPREQDDSQAGLGSLPGVSESPGRLPNPDRKSTRLNSSHDQISYAVFCLKKKKTEHIIPLHQYVVTR